MDDLSPHVTDSDPNASASSGSPSPLQWIRGDLHNHCERHELVEAHFSGVADRLDFVALTNHAQKPVFFEQDEMVSRARQLTDIHVLFGLEWNAAEGRHANVIFPPGSREAEHAYAFSRAHDRRVDGSHPDIEAAIARLDSLSVTGRPVLFFNHPIPGDWSAPVLDRYLDAGSNQMVCGIEAVHGHQAQAVVETFDLKTYPGCAVGGLADHVYATGRPFSVLANSDFHIHKQEKGEYDYPLGIFNHTLVGISSDGEADASAIFQALRAGRTCASQGHWLRFADFSIRRERGGVVAVMGDTWRSNAGGAVLRIEFEALEETRSIDVIGRLSAASATSVLHSFGGRPAGPCELELEIPSGSSGYVRLQVISDSDERPPPGPQLPKAFLTSAIFLASS